MSFAEVIILSANLLYGKSGVKKPGEQSVLGFFFVFIVSDLTQIAAAGKILADGIGINTGSQGNDFRAVIHALSENINPDLFGYLFYLVPVTGVYFVKSGNIQHDWFSLGCFWGLSEAEFSGLTGLSELFD